MWFDSTRLSSRSLALFLFRLSSEPLADGLTAATSSQLQRPPLFLRPTGKCKARKASTQQPKAPVHEARIPTPRQVQHGCLAPLCALRLAHERLSALMQALTLNGHGLSCPCKGCMFNGAWRSSCCAVQLTSCVHTETGMHRDTETQEEEEDRHAQRHRDTVATAYEIQ